MYGMSHTCSKLERTISCDDVLIKKRQRRYYGNVTIHPMEVTSMGKEQPQRYHNPGFIGPHSLKMHLHIASFVKSAKRPAGYQSGMKCHYKAFLKLRYLIIGA